MISRSTHPVTNEDRALVPACPSCGVASGERCLEHWPGSDETPLYRLVHWSRGKLAGLSSSETLRLDFGDRDDKLEEPELLDELTNVMARAGDDFDLAMFGFDVALRVAEQAGGNALAIARLRALHGKLTPNRIPNTTPTSRP